MFYLLYIFSRLDGILNTHKSCILQMNDLNSMRNWTHIIRTLQSQRLELLKVQQSVCMKWNNYNLQNNGYNKQIFQINKLIEPKQNQCKLLKNKIDEYKKQITEIYEKISKLSVKRKILEKQIHSTNGDINKYETNIKQLNATKNEYILNINNNRLSSHKLIEFMKTIDLISKQYCNSVEIMQKKVNKFEPNYKQWNQGEVVTWFENINGGILNKSHSFLNFKTQLIQNGISGKDLINLNNLSLKMMGLKDDKQRLIVINHLNKLQTQKN